MSRYLSKPPEDIPPEKLIRLIMRRPYPVIPIDYRIRGAESIALSVRAITWEEEMEIQDTYSDNQDSLHLAYLSKSLLADGQQAFESYKQASFLSENEIEKLVPEVATSFSKMCPSIFRSDMPAWEFCIYQGAKHFSNSNAISAALCCIEEGMGMTTHRLDRFYNMPLLELTEGHGLVFRSLCKAISEAMDEHRQQSKNRRS